MSITSNEVNFLIYRYLQESGFHHSAFSFGHESFVFQSNISGADVPPGALISIIQKGLQYVEAETHLNEDGTEIECNEPFSLLTPHVCKAKDSDKERKRKERDDKRSDKKEAKRMKREHSASMDKDKTDDDDRVREKNRDKDRDRDGEKKDKNKDKEKSRDRDREKDKERKDRDKNREKDKNRDRDEDQDEGKDERKGREHDEEGDGEGGETRKKDKERKGKDEEGEEPRKGGTGDEAAAKQKETNGMAIDDDDTATLPEFKVRKLKGHQEQCLVAWNPTSDHVATGAADGSGRIWDSTGPEKEKPFVELKTEPRGGKQKEEAGITSLEWSPSGAHLAVASYDGTGRIWSKSGQLQHTLEHTAASNISPIFTIRWNKSGTALLTGGGDKAAVVWDYKTGSQRQRFSFHDKAVFDVDWMDDETFATASYDAKIYLCRLGQDNPLRTYRHEAKKITAIRFNPTGTTLASCAEDPTVKLWKPDRDTFVQQLKGHTKDVSNIDWCRDPASARLASGSVDQTVKLWDVEAGKQLQSYECPAAVEVVAFSPDSRILAAASVEGQAFIRFLCTSSGKVVREYTPKNGVVDLKWNHAGTMLCAGSALGTALVLDFRGI